MTFSWPWMLLTLLAVPALGVGYRRLLRRQAARRAQLAALGLVATGPTATGPTATGPTATGPTATGPAGGGARRHAGPALLLLALSCLFVASARPVATVADPRREGTVVLAFDVSSSMAATDVKPTRMAAAELAARAFVRQQPRSIRIAVVAFGESGVIVQQPTTDRTAVLAAVDRLTPQGATALGRGIQTSLSAIAGRTVELGQADGSGGGSDGSAEAPGPDLGYFGSAAVVLLSDGENTNGPDPQAAADLASTAGVRIYPVGLGSAAGSVLQLDGFQVATALDEPVLRQIAAVSDGQYFSAADAGELARIYGSIDLRWTARSRPLEITALFAGAAALLLLAGAGLSFVRFGRVI